MISLSFLKLGHSTLVTERVQGPWESPSEQLEQEDFRYEGACPGTPDTRNGEWLC